MKFIVFSDSHGVSDNMIRAVKLEKPDLCFYLGDGENDLRLLQNRFPQLPVNAVRGNCDTFSSFRDYFNETVCCNKTTCCSNKG